MFMNTDVNLKSWACGMGATGRDSAGASLGAMPQSQMPLEQQGNAQRTASRCSTPHDGPDTEAPATCAIRKMTAVMSRVQGCLMEVKRWPFVWVWV